MNKPLVMYIMSFTIDGSKWMENQYARENGYDDLVKMAKKKLKKDGVLSVKIEKKTKFLKLLTFVQKTFQIIVFSSKLTHFFYV